MGTQTNIAQSLMNIALDTSGVDLTKLPIPETKHFSSATRLTYYSEHVRRIQIERAHKLKGSTNG